MEKVVPNWAAAGLGLRGWEKDGGTLFDPGRLPQSLINPP
jgi:hypothetical protein